MRAGGKGIVASAADARTFQLAQEITELASRARWSRGRHLTELELASALSVSRTPVRSALRLLEAHGCVGARPNRGFFLLRDGEGLSALIPAVPATADAMLQNSIVRDRAAGQLPGTVTVGRLIERYGARRANLERVLGRLVAEGLLTREPGHKWRFAPSLEGETGVRASYQVRLLLEPGALLLEGGAVEPHVIGEQQRRHERLLAAIGNAARWRRRPSPGSVFDLDAGFHESLAEFSGNSFVVGLVRQQNALRRLLEFDSYRDMQRVAAWVKEHLAILDALAAADLPLASRRLHDHLARAALVAARNFPTTSKAARR